MEKAAPDYAGEGGTYFEAVMDHALAVRERDRGRINGTKDKDIWGHEHLWARVETLESCESKVITNVHPLSYLRGNVTEQQFDEFLKTYDIREGDRMYLAPEDRILVW